jgi:CheY-like chemotaxis protein
MKLLFVEDHAAFVKTVIPLFMSEHAVTVAPSIAAAREELSTGSFDALLVDYDLPDGKGDEVVREVRDTGSRVPIVAVSSHDAGNARLLDAGANVVCAKRAFSIMGATLGGLAPLPERGALRAPSPRALAAIVAACWPTLTPSQTLTLERILDELLFSERESWDGFLARIITHTELRNLLLAHVHTTIERMTGHLPDFVAYTLAITTEFERGLFVAADGEATVSGGEPATIQGRRAEE